MVDKKPASTDKQSPTYAAELCCLKWKQTRWAVDPCWAVEPDVSSIRAVIQTVLESTEDCKVDFLAEGAFNKVYKVQSREESLIMRISLPLDPHFKTESEVATLRFMQEHGGVPIPAVRAYNSSRVNSIGFEWILMEFMPGASLEDRWHEMSWAAKETIAKQLALHYSRMSKHRFSAIGNIYPEPAPSSTSTPEIQRIVAMQFFCGDLISQPVSRGPFKSSHEWMAARLSLYEADARKMLLGDGEDERKYAEKTLNIVTRLQKLLPQFFPEDQEEVTILVHYDLNWWNILVDEDGILSAVVDWEFVPAIPLWRAYDYPRVLEGIARDEKPDPEKHGRDEDGELTELYWEHLEEYEMTQLRLVFREEVEKLVPG